jgi:hypothetical protein
MSKVVLYDKAAWHSDGDFPADLPPEAGATHIGMFFAWAVTRGLAGDLHTANEPGLELHLITERRITPGEAAQRFIDGRLTNEDFSDEGNAFAADYYQGKKPYYDDLEELRRALAVKSVYHIPDSWAVFDRLAKVVDQRFKRWKSPGLFAGLFRR